LKLVEVKYNRFTVYDDNGKVLIITSDRGVALRYMKWLTQ